MIDRNVQLVAFDAFGTLVEIQSPRNPYRMLPVEMNIAFTPEIRHIAMAQPLEFEDFARAAVPTCTSEALVRARNALDEEIASVTLFEHYYRMVRRQN